MRASPSRVSFVATKDALLYWSPRKMQRLWSRRSMKKLLRRPKIANKRWRSSAWKMLEDCWLSMILLLYNFNFWQTEQNHILFKILESSKMTSHNKIYWQSKKSLNVNNRYLFRMLKSYYMLSWIIIPIESFGWWDI